MKKRIGIMISVLGLSFMSGAAYAQTQPAPAEPTRATQPRTPDASAPSVPSVPPVPPVPAVPPVPPVDPFADVIFPPDLIMRHSRELGLTIEQKAILREEIQRTTTRFNELQWQLQDAMELLHQTMESNLVNDQQALSQLDKVLDVEREIKRLHVGLGIRIKNQLTSEQQTKLQGLRRTPAPTPHPTPRPR